MVVLALPLPASARRVSLRVDTAYADQNVFVNGVWIGRHGGAFFGLAPSLRRRVPGLRCHADGTPRARLVNAHVTFAMAALAQDAVCGRDAVGSSTVSGRGDRVRLGFGTVRIGRRTPAAVRRRLTYLREDAGTVTYGVSRVGNVCTGRPATGWQVTLTVSKRTHDAVSVRVFSGFVEVICP